MESSKIEFSLIVPTLNRTIELEKLLLSLKTQTLPNFEVIVVDQNPDNRLDEILNKFSDLKITHLKSKKKGLSLAKNKGIDVASGEILSFPDDDCEYPPDLLDKVRCFLNDESITGVSVLIKDKETGKHFATFLKKKRYIQKWNLFHTACESATFLKKKKLENLRFDINFGVGAQTKFQCDEGPDLFLRMINKGLKIFYVPELCIYHPFPVKKYDEKAMQRAYLYGCGRGAFLRKNKYPFWFVGYQFLIPIVKAGLSCITFNFPKIKFDLKSFYGRVEGYLTYKATINKSSGRN